MKCLLVSDLHYALKQFDWTLAVAGFFDVVVIAGDHLDISGHVDGQAQIVVILKYLARLSGKVKLIVSSGNHDLDAHNPMGEKITSWIGKVRDFGVPTDGDSPMIGDTLFSVCPWWDGPCGRDEVARQLACDAKKTKQRWVWVYHAPPDFSPTSWTGDRYVGDAELVAWMKQYAPDIVLTGHIHQAPFCKGGSWLDQIGPTWVFNSGRQIGPTPAHIALDFGRNEASWFSLAGAEFARLDRPLTRPPAELPVLPDWLRL